MSGADSLSDNSDVERGLGVGISYAASDRGTAFQRP